VVPTDAYFSKQASRDRLLLFEWPLRKKHRFAVAWSSGKAPEFGTALSINLLRRVTALTAPAVYCTYTASKCTELVHRNTNKGGSVYLGGDELTVSTVVRMLYWHRGICIISVCCTSMMTHELLSCDVLQ